MNRKGIIEIGVKCLAHPLHVIPLRGLTAAVIQYERKRSCCPTLHVIPLTGLDLFASDIETCKHVSASLSSCVIPAFVLRSRWRIRSAMTLFCNLLNRRSSNNGFTLVEMLVALVVAAVLTGVSLNIFGTFCHGIAETTARYERFLTEKVTELRCRTRFVRGVANNVFPCNDAFGDSYVNLHTYFRF